MQESPAGSPDERREAAKPAGPAAASSPFVPDYGHLPRPPEATFSESVRNAIRFLYNNNPFYVISAALIFWGLRSSFDTTGKTFETDAFMISLAGYTLLLAVAGCFLIRLGQVWDDVRTILLLVVLMLLALSVSFDEALAHDSSVGIWYYLGGLLFAVAVSEGTLRTIRLRLPALFRIPYYLFLGLFFLYPVAISPLIRDASDPTGMRAYGVAILELARHSPLTRDASDPALLWALFGFSPLAAVLTLTLLPAVRRGPRYVRHNGSPWRWPWYPWMLFGTFALAVCGRSYYLCCSFHFVGGSATIFRPYFLVPFLFAVNVLVLEAGLRSRLKNVTLAALLAPLAIVLLGLANPARPMADHGFFDLFHETLGATPAYFTLIAASVFYAYAMLRRADRASWGLTAALVALSVIGPETTGLAATWAGPIGWPLLVAGVLHLGLTVERRHSLHALLAAVLLLAGLAAQFHDTSFMAYRGLVPVHLLILAILVIGVAFKDPLAKVLQRVGIAGLLGGSVVAVTETAAGLGNPPAMLVAGYPLAAAAVGVVFLLLTANREYLLAVFGGVLAWLVRVGWPGYQQARNTLEGLDKIVLGGLFLLIALAISLGKAGLYRRIRRRSDK